MNNGGQVGSIRVQSNPRTCDTLVLTILDSSSAAAMNDNDQGTGLLEAVLVSSAGGPRCDVQTAFEGGRFTCKF